MSRARIWPLVALAHLCTLSALLVFTAANALPMAAPLAWAGAIGMPAAWLFNLLAWILPGVSLAFVAIRLRKAAPARGLGVGIALQLCLLAALAFAAQGVWQLDPAALDAGASRLHATAWMIWLLAFGAGALVSGLAMPAIRWPALAICAVCLLSPALLGPVAGPRVVLLAWWGWTLMLAVRVPGVASSRPLR